MRTPTNLRERARTYTSRHMVSWTVAACRGQGCDTERSAELSYPLQPPKEADVLAQTPQVATWVAEWRQVDEASTGWASGVQVEWALRQWANAGHNRLPVRAVITGAEEIARAGGRLEEYRRSVDRAKALNACVRATRTGLAPAVEYTDAGRREEDLTRALSSVLREASSWEASDFQCLIGFLSWIRDHDVHGMYLRQIPVPGLHSKWLETHQRVVAILVPLVRPDLTAGKATPSPGEAAVSGEAPASNNAVEHAPKTSPATRLAQLLGLRVAEASVRIRILDSALAPDLPSDLRLPMSEAAALWGTPDHRWAPQHAIIVENLATFLALEQIPGTVAVWGEGYRAAEFGVLPWLHSVDRVLYWGDLDCDGLAIVSAVRGWRPDCVSVAMDTHTIETWRKLGVADPHAGRNRGRTPPTHMSDHERAAWDTLQADGLRIEQERIDWQWARDAIAHAMAN